jgi:site-specific DNA recombinase
MELMEMANRELDSLAQSDGLELKNINKSVEDANRRLERLYNAIETGHLDLADLALRIKELRTCQEQLLSRRVQIENRLAEKKVNIIDTKTMVRYSAEMREIIESGSLAHRKAFIRGFVKDIKVTGDKAVMTYTMPELPDKVELDIAGVPRTVTHGGR